MYLVDKKARENEFSHNSFKTITITRKLFEMTNGEEFLTGLKANTTKQSS